MKSLILYSLILFFAFPCMATELVSKGEKESFLFKQLTNAKTKKPFDTKEVQKKKSVWIVFQLGCSTCHKVMSEGACYNNRKDVEVFAVGLYATPKELLKDAKKSKFKGEVLTSALEVDKDLDLDVTPTIFIFDKDKLLKRHESYASCAEIKKHLQI